MTYNHQLIAGTYTVFATPKECKEAFERAKELGIRIYDYCDNWETELCYTEHDGVNCITAYHRGLCKHFQVITNKIPHAEFLARMEGTWGQSAENAHSNHSEIPNSSNQLLGNPEQLTLSEVKEQLENDGWYFRTIDGMWFGKMDGNMCLLSESMGYWEAIIVDYHIDPNNTNQIMPHIQQAIDACTLLNNAKHE